VESAARNPQSVTLDPTTVSTDTLTERRRRGDLTVVVRYNEALPPIVLGVYMHLPLDGPPERSGPGGVKGSHKRNTPTTMRALRRAILAAGCRLEPGGSSHEKVISPEGRVISSLSNTPSDHRTIPNAVAELRRKGVDI
jgi:hypothetical protein